MLRPTSRILPVLACLAVCGALLAACGDDGGDSSKAASADLEQALAATSKIDSGRVTASFKLEPDGLVSLGGPITLRASGPFAAPAAGELPRMRLAIAASLAGRPFEATATSTGKRAFLRLGGRDYELGDELVKSLAEILGGARGGGFASLGLDPSAWIKDTQDKGAASIGGVDTTHVAGDVDPAKLLADLARLLDGTGFGGLLTPTVRDQIAGAVRSAKVDVYSGVDDKILRQLDLAVDFKFDNGADSPLAGLDGGRFNMRLRLDDVNASTVKPAAPKNAQPLERLFSEGGLSSLLGGFGVGTAAAPTRVQTPRSSRATGS